MSGSLLVIFFLFLAVDAEGEQPILEAAESSLHDQPRFSCFTSQYRRLSTECFSQQKVCYYTRRIPRFASDFRPKDMIGRGCDVRRNKEPDSCQAYTKGLDTFIRCECGFTDCNSHYWHGFAVAAFHHRKVLNEEKERRNEGGGVAPVKYSDWFMLCFQLMALLWVYYFVVDLIKKYRFQKRAVLMRSVLVARGTQQAEAVQWNLEKPEVTIHNYKTSFVKLIDGFIRYRSLGSLPAVDIKQLHATWLLGRQELHRIPSWFIKKEERLDKQALAYNEASVEVARIGTEQYFTEATVKAEMELVRRMKRADRKKVKTELTASSELMKEQSDPEEGGSSRKGTRNEDALNNNRNI